MRSGPCLRTLNQPQKLSPGANLRGFFPWYVARTAALSFTESRSSPQTDPRCVAGATILRRVAGQAGQP